MNYWQSILSLAILLTTTPMALGVPVTPDSSTPPDSLTPDSLTPDPLTPRVDPVNPQPTSQTQDPKLDLGDLVLIREQAGIANRFVLKGTVVNRGTEAVRSLKVLYREYRQDGQELVEVSGGEMTVAPEEIQLGTTGNFGTVLTNEPEVILITAFSSSSAGEIEVLQCYADTLARREICRRQFNTTSTFPFARP
ncbi:MAG: hypothetical protein ACRC8A_02000 [Microcoleaceae cyanobacterium]